MAPSAQLSVLVPTHNEQASILSTLNDLRFHLPQSEILVIDGGSDRTEEIVRKWTKSDNLTRYFRNLNDKGKGHAIREGIKLASQDFIAQFDADGQFFAKDLARLLDMISRSEIDILCGSRFMKNSERNLHSVPGARSVGNRAINLYASLFFQDWRTDVLSGLKIWRREVTESIRLHSDRFCYEVEILMKAKRAGFKVSEAPIATKERQGGKSKVQVWKCGFELLKEIPKFKFERMNRAS